MSEVFTLNTGQTILGHDGQAVANGQVHFYDKKTGEYASVYGDAALTVSLRQPVQADSSGVLPAIYLDDAVAYRAVITDRKNNRIREIDDVGRHRPGIKVLAGIEALKRYCGKDPFVLVAGEDGCPVFYKRLSGCDLPPERLPKVVHADCCPDCCTAWQICGGSELDICAMETAELNCDYHVLVQECRRRRNPDDTVNPEGYADDCRCDGSPDAAPAVKKASIGALLSAGARCLPRVCILHDAPELALDPSGGLVYGDREPPPIQSSATGEFATCMRIFVGTQTDDLSHHLQLDKAVDLRGNVARAPEITVTNPGPCCRRYEIRALNRLNRAREKELGWPSGAPAVDANFQTRLGKAGDPRLDDPYGITDYQNTLLWLEDLSIADSTMGAFMSGLPHSTGTIFLNQFPAYLGANGYTENTIVVDLNSGASIKYVLKYHIYWDMNASPADLAVAERIHFGTRIIARQVR